MQIICHSCDKTFFIKYQSVSRPTKYCSLKCVGKANSIKKLFWENSTEESRLEKYKNLFEKKVIINVDACWGWNGSLDTTGSGWIAGRRFRKHAYRVSWMIHKGSIPKGLLVLHKCHNRVCSNPDHLYLGTHKDNTRDMFLSGRNKSCQQNSKNAKLDRNKAKEIKEFLKTKTQYEIARMYNVSRGTIQDIHRGKTWKEV